MTKTDDAERQLVEAFNSILTDLLGATGASRTTLRLEMPEYGFHPDEPVSEAKQEGIKSLIGERSLKQRTLNTVRWLDEHRELLIQESCRDADPAPPPALIEVYGVQAQMLAPVEKNGDLIAWVSVHETKGVRKWTEKDIAALKEAQAKVDTILATEAA